MPHGRSIRPVRELNYAQELSARLSNVSLGLTPALSTVAAGARHTRDAVDSRVGFK
jgi:hypothetical protein